MSAYDQIKVTHQVADSKVFPTVLKVHTYTHADLDGTNKIAFPIEKGWRILGVYHLTKVAFNAAADLDVGDSADADGYLTQAQLTPTTLNNFVLSTGGAAAYAQGKYYAATDRVILAFTADPSAGEGELGILISGDIEQA